jgi:hypothetical protein
MVHSYKSIPDEETHLSAKSGNMEDEELPLSTRQSLSTPKKMLMVFGAWCGLLVFTGTTPQSMMAFVSSSWNGRNLQANTIRMCVKEMILIEPLISRRALVECHDKDPNGDDFMVSGVTDDDGCVTMSYTKQDWDGSVGGEAPDIYCAVTKKGFVRAVPNDKDHHDQTKVADFGTVTLFRDRTHDKGATNGCGPEFSSIINPAASLYFRVLRFDDQCFHHDKCYWDCQIFLALQEEHDLTSDQAAAAAQEFCDYEMYQGMRSYCFYNNGALPGLGEDECLSAAEGVYRLLQTVGSTFAYNKSDDICPIDNGQEAPSMLNDYSHVETCTANGKKCGHDGTFGDVDQDCNYCCAGVNKIAKDEGYATDDLYCECLPRDIMCGSTSGINWNNCGRCCNGSRKDAGQWWENDYYYCL